MKYLLIALLLVPAALQAQSRMQTVQNNTVQETAAMEQFKAAWFRFADALIAKDTALLRKLSAPCISCSICGDEKLVPIARFLDQGLQDLSRPDAKVRLKDSSKLHFVDDTHNRDLYQAPCMQRPDSLSRQKEALVRLVDPSDSNEGFQLAFSFMETPEGYKFCGFSSIP